MGESAPGGGKGFELRLEHKSLMQGGIIKKNTTDICPNSAEFA